VVFRAAALTGPQRRPAARPPGRHCSPMLFYVLFRLYGFFIDRIICAALSKTIPLRLYGSILNAFSIFFSFLRLFQLITLPMLKCEVL